MCESKLLRSLTAVIAFIYLSFLSSTSYAAGTNITICSIDAGGTRGTPWTLNGSLGANLRSKLLNAANFSPPGIEPINFTIVDAFGTSGSISVASLQANGCEVFFKGYIADSDITTAERNAMFTWVNTNGGTLLSFADDGQYNAFASNFGHTTTNSSATSWTANATGLAHPIFDGPFGTGSVLNTLQQKTFYNNTVGATVLATETGNTSNATILDRVAGNGHAVFAGDVDVVTRGVSNGDGNNTDQDHVVLNMFAYVASTYNDNNYTPPVPTITSPADGSSTTDNSPTVSGTADPGVTITVTGPLGETCTTTADPTTGAWSCTITPDLADGSNTLSATATFGNNTSGAATVTINVDTTPPAAPTCTVTPDPANNGTLLTANCTGVETGATVTIPGYNCGAESGNEVVCTATAGTAGVDGDEQATTTDALGNSVNTNAFFTLDNTPPTIGTCTVTPDPANNGTTVTANCTGVEGGATLTIPGYVCTDNGSGNWSCTGTVGTAGVDGDETATATDPAGNTATTPANFTLDNTPPAIGTCTVTPDPANNGTTVTANCTGVEGGATLTIPGYVCTDNGSGNWSCDGTVGTAGVDGDETATATDPAGNTATTPANFTLDNTPPVAPICTVTPDPANNGTALTATCTGVETGATVTIPGYVCGAESGNQVTCTGTAGQNGVDGTEDATVSDAAGNSTDAPANFTLDNTPPAAAVCTVTPDPANNGTAVTATCTGVETGATLSIPGYSCSAEFGGTVTCTGTVGTAGVDGDEDATVTDAAGNSTDSPANFTLDNTPPAAALCTVTPDPANDGTALTATCTGVETGATVTIPGYVCGAESGNEVVCTGTAGQNGVDGTEDATTTDAAGNSTDSPANFTLDNTPPAIGACTVTPDPANNGTAVTANCTGVEAGATLTIPGYACTDNGSGNWSCTGTVGTAGVDGDETATATDPAGNTATTPANFTLDNTPPAAAVCTVTPDPANDGTALTATCTGVESGATVTIPGYVCGAESGNEVLCTGTAGQNGVDGTEDATITDAAGNSTDTPANFTLDNTPPAAPVCTVTPDPANNGTALTATCTGVESGATVTIPGYTCGAEAGNEVVCTGTAGQNGVDGTEDATVTDAAGNSTDTPANFTLDNTPPAAPVCTVTPDPANNGTAVTATCTGVETGATVTIPGYSCSAESGGTVTCTGTVGTAGVDGDEDATVTDAAGNSTDTPANFTLDNTPPAAAVCTVTPDPANDGTALTATCTGVETGATVTIPGYVCGVEAGNEVVCTGTAGQNGVDGTEDATVTDAAGNSTDSPANFTLDNTPPAIGACTITPDPANNGTALTATCTGVETGAAVTIPGYVCGAEAGNEVICTGTAGQNGVDGTEEATATDAAGNTADTPANFVLDNDVPAAPGIDTPTNGAPVSGTGEPGATVTVTTPSGATCTTTVLLDGTWSCNLVPDPVDGEDITATQEDEAGNTSPPTTVSGGIDTTAPSAPTIDPVDDTTDPVSGTAEPGTTINLTGVVCDNDPVITDATGNWFCVVTTTAPLVPGTLITATATDTAGNESLPASTTVGDSATQSVSPTVNPVANGATQITGTAVAGSTIDLSGITCANAPVTADAMGNWSCDTPAPVPVTNDVISVTATQGALLPSPPVTTTVYDPGVTAPPAPQVNPTDGDPVEGTTIPNGDITVLDINGVILCTTTADPAGNFSCSPVLPAPVHDDVLNVIVTDDNGNSSLPTQVIVDAVAPTAPVCTVSPDPANNGTALTATCTGVETDATVTIPGYVCGAEAGNEVVCTGTAGQNGVDGTEDATVTDAAGNSTDAPANFILDNTPPAAAVCTVTPDPANDGTALTATCTGVETGATVTIPGYVCGAENGNEVVCTGTAGQNGVDGTEDATVTDAAGNSTDTPANFTLDNTPPAAPVCTVTPDPANNGTAVTATCTGVETGATVTIPGYTCGAEAGNEVVCTGTAGQNGVDGTEDATVTDAAGNSTDTPANFTLDNTPPAAPVCTVTPDPANDGTALTATCTGVETGATVTIPGYVCGAESGNEVVCTGTAGQNGVDGTEDATVTDAAGNSTDTPANFTLDNTPPAAPVCTVTPDPANDGTALTATCTGVETGATVTIPGYVCGAEAGNEVVCTGTAGQNGVDGTEDATVTDAAGNSVDTPANFTLDNTAPGGPTITAPTDGITINTNTPLIVGTGEPDSIITVTGPNGETCTTTVNSSGDWSCTLSPALQDGNGQVITAVAADEAGNESAPDSITIGILNGQAYDVLIDDRAELVTTEMGGTDSFDVSLPLTPLGDVTVNFSSSDTGEGTVSPSSVTFNTSNWDQPVTVTVTGVDDPDYDLDQNYQILISALVSPADSNYDGVDPADLDAVNIDDDESPDLTAFITNCVAGVLPTDSMVYRLTVNNTGNKDISAATVNTVFSNLMTTPSWVCQASGGASCGNLSGNGDLNETVDLPVGSELLYLFDADVTGALTEFIDVEGSVTMPLGETDVNPGDNTAFDSDLIYLFLMKDGFDCAAPGTIQSTNEMLERLISQ